MLKASFKPYQLTFKQQVLTSRGSMQVKNGYYLSIADQHKTGIGECSFIEGLSIDDLTNYTAILNDLCRDIENGVTPSFDKDSYPSINFAYESALQDFSTGGEKKPFESEFTQGCATIPINGLVWMGKKDFMLAQIKQKLKEGFNCIKIKVAAIDFAEEVSLLEYVRNKFPADLIQLRLDANGGFNASDVFRKLDALAKFDIHSIEQPVKQRQVELMRNVCANSPIPVALDEELIGLYGAVQDDLLDMIKPQYIILKPSLLGGLNICDDWIDKAKHRNIKWWATSALESNIGLNVIAQWAYTKKNAMVQGLGTGALYSNNISSPLYIQNGELGFNPALGWGSI